MTQLPATLKKRFAFVDSRIAWTDTARRQTLARKFLESNRLVREYQTRDVLRSLAEITRDETIGESTRLTALQWAFKAWSSGRGLAAQDTLAANLHVLTRGGWRGADEALFGDGGQARKEASDLRDFLRIPAIFHLPWLGQGTNCWFRLPIWVLKETTNFTGPHS